VLSFFFTAQRQGAVRSAETAELSDTGLGLAASPGVSLGVCNREALLSSKAGLVKSVTVCV